MSSISTTMQPARLTDLLDPRELFAEIEAGYVVRKDHPTLPLSIYTYSRACQYDRHWNQVTTQCRGLVVAHSGEIVGRPFPKFFNVAEHELGRDYAPPLPQDDQFEIHEKVDGSLGIVFHYAGKWHVASKGSFISEQAQWAQRWLDERNLQELYPGMTYLVEIVYPENRIVVDNGQEHTLVLLAIMRPDGFETPASRFRMRWQAIGGRVARSWPSLPLGELVGLAAANQKVDGTRATGTDAEGYVIRFSDGTRAKVKFDEYVRLHKVMTGLTARDVWRALAVQRNPAVPTKRLAIALRCSEDEIWALRAVGRPFDALLDGTPDEFDAWVFAIAASLTRDVDALQAEIDVAYAELRREFAAKANTYRPQVRAGLFLKLDGRDLGAHLWREAQPEGASPFREDEEG
jgi:RNA ligase